MKSNLLILLASLTSYHALDLPMQTKFDKIISFGDSLTDYNNCLEISNNTVPDSRYYDNGRYSNGPTWIEHIAKKLKTNIVNFSYAGATSDNIGFKATNVKGGVPGAIQQQEEFANYYKNLEPSQKNCERTLFTFVYGGNDYSLPNASPQKVMANLEKAVRTLLSSHDVKYLLIGIGTPLDKAPKVTVLPSPYPETFEGIELMVEQMWKDIIVKLKQEYPEATFYSFNARDSWLKLANGVAPVDGKTDLESVKPCLSRTFEAGVIVNATRCEDPSRYLFWDELHPTTQVHNFLANEAMDIIYS